MHKISAFLDSTLVFNRLLSLVDLAVSVTTFSIVTSSIKMLDADICVYILLCWVAFFLVAVMSVVAPSLYTNKSYN